MENVGIIKENMATLILTSDIVLKILNKSITITFNYNYNSHSAIT